MIPILKWIASMFRRIFRRDKSLQEIEPAMAAAIIATRRSARLVYQRRNGIEPRMDPVRHRRRRRIAQ